MTALGLLYAVGLAAAILPAQLQGAQNMHADTCGARITELEEQVEYAVGSPRIIHFIEDNTTAFESLHQKYLLYWLNTKFTWDNDLSRCSAHLEEITASFELGNSTVPFIGMAHITVNPGLTRVTGLQLDIHG